MKFLTNNVTDFFVAFIEIFLSEQIFDAIYFIFFDLVD